MFKYVLEKEWSLTFGQWEEGCIFQVAAVVWSCHTTRFLSLGHKFSFQRRVTKGNEKKGNAKKCQGNP